MNNIAGSITKGMRYALTIVDLLCHMQYPELQ